MSTLRTGPLNSICDISGLRVGNAIDSNVKTGVTVLTGDAPFTASYAVMGGAPGTRDTDLLEPDKTVQSVDAIVLSGGSAFGLDSAGGVAHELRAAGRGFAVGDVTIPIVPTAILFDMANGGDKNWETSPYTELGRKALLSADTNFDIGSAGAGFGALCGITKGGLGTSSLMLEAGGTVGALIAANPVGNALTPDGKHFWAAPFEIDNEFGGFGISQNIAPSLGIDQSKLGALHPQANTTIGIVATDFDLDKAELKRLAIAVHDGLARAIYPSHLPYDGDLIFAVSTGKIEKPKDPVLLSTLSSAAAHCVARAVARGVYHAQAEDGDLKPTARQIIDG